MRFDATLLLISEVWISHFSFKLNDLWFIVIDYREILKDAIYPEKTRLFHPNLFNHLKICSAH
jgi:hypothetical protein